MKRKLALRERTGLLAAWSELFRRTDETALTVGADRELRDAIREANELYPAAPPITNVELVHAEPKRATRILLMALVLVAAVGAAATLIGGGDLDRERCTFADGTSVTGTCMFVEEFDVDGPPNPDVWLAENEWGGPINNLVPELGCFREENAVVSGGMLELRVTANARASCPQSWENTAFYQANWLPDWPVGQPTSFDLASVTMKTFRFKYGAGSFEVKSAGGVGPGPGFALWGVDCLSATQGIIGHYLGGFFAHQAGANCRFPVRPGSSEIDLWAYRPTDPPWMNFADYVDNSVGTPPLIGTFFGTSYYGAVWGGAPGMTAFVTGAPAPSDPTANFHKIGWDWRPGSVKFYIDGVMYVNNTSDWTQDELMGAMLNTSDVVTVTGATLPQTTYVKNFYVWCPPEVPCEYEGAAP